MEPGAALHLSPNQKNATIRPKDPDLSGSISTASQSDSALAPSIKSADVTRVDSPSSQQDTKPTAASVSLLQKREQMKRYLRKLRALVPQKHYGRPQGTLGALKHVIRSINSTTAASDKAGRKSSLGPVEAHQGMSESDTDYSDLSLSTTASNCSMVVSMADLQIQYGTQQLAKIMGYKQAALSEQNLLAVIHPDDHKILTDQLTGIITENNRGVIRSCNMLFRLQVRQRGYGVRHEYMPVFGKAYIRKPRPPHWMTDSLTDSPSLSDESLPETQAKITPPYAKPKGPPPWNARPAQPDGNAQAQPKCGQEQFSKPPPTGDSHSRIDDDVSEIGEPSSDFTSPSTCISPSPAPPTEGNSPSQAPPTEGNSPSQAPPTGNSPSVSPTQGNKSAEPMGETVDGAAAASKPAMDGDFAVPAQPKRSSRDICIVIKCTPIESAYTEQLQMPEKRTFSVRHTPQCRYDHVESAAISLLGFMPCEMLGTLIFDYFMPEDLPMLYGVYQQVITTPGRLVPCQPYMLRIKNGDCVMVDTEWSSYANPWSGQLEFVICKHTILQGPQDIDIFKAGRGQAVAESPQATDFQQKILQLLANQQIEKPPQTEMPNIKPVPIVTPAAPGSDKQALVAGTREGQAAAIYDSLLTDKNISLLYHGLSYTQNIKRFLLTCGSDVVNELPSISESTSDLDVSLPLPRLESCASSTKALISEMEPREEMMSPHHEPEALIHDIDAHIEKSQEMMAAGKAMDGNDMIPGLNDGSSHMMADCGGGEDMDTDAEEKPYMPMLMTEENLKNHQNKEMKLYIERMIQEKASLILTQYQSRLKRSHSGEVPEHRPNKYRLVEAATTTLTTPTYANFPVTGITYATGRRIEADTKQCEQYNTFIPYQLQHEIQEAVPATTALPKTDTYSWKHSRELHLLPRMGTGDGVVQGLTTGNVPSWRYKKNKVSHKSTTSSDSSISWLTGTSSQSEFGHGHLTPSKCVHAKVMQDSFWLQGIQWSNEVQFRYRCVQRVVTTKGMRHSLRKLTAPKMIKQQLQELANQSSTNDTDNMQHSPARTSCKKSESAPSPRSVESATDSKPESHDTSGSLSPRAASMSPPNAASMSGESDSNSNEKSENGSGGESSSLTISHSSYGENSSSMKESDDMSHPEIGPESCGSKSERMFIPVSSKAAAHHKMPFWMEDVKSNSSVASASQQMQQQQLASLYYDKPPSANAAAANQQYCLQPEGVLQQLQELLAEMHCTSDDADTDDSDEKKSYQFSNGSKPFSGQQREKSTNAGSSMGDSGFKSSATSCTGHNSSSISNKQTGSSAGESGSDKKGIERDGCEVTMSSDSDGSNKRTSSSSNVNVLHERDDENRGRNRNNTKYSEGYDSINEMNSNCREGTDSDSNMQLESTESPVDMDQSESRTKLTSESDSRDSVCCRDAQGNKASVNFDLSNSRGGGRSVYLPFYPLSEQLNNTDPMAMDGSSGSSFNASQEPPSKDTYVDEYLTVLFTHRDDDYLLYF